MECEQIRSNVMILLSKDNVYSFFDDVTEDVRVPAVKVENVYSTKDSVKYYLVSVEALYKAGIVAPERNYRSENNWSFNPKFVTEM